MVERIISIVSAAPPEILVVVGLTFFSATFALILVLKLLKRRRAAAAEAAAAEKLRLAVATLLAVVALGDGRIDTDERAAIERLVRERFGLSEIAAGRLIDAAEREARDEIDLVPFTGVIKDNYPPAERGGLIGMCWEVCYASGEPHDHQDSQVRGIAGLIHVTDRERGAARKHVLERRAAAGLPTKSSNEATIPGTKGNPDRSSPTKRPATPSRPKSRGRRSPRKDAAPDQAENQ